jgi:hypothetical protein
MEPVGGRFINKTLAQICGEGQRCHQGRCFIGPLQQQVRDPGHQILKGMMLILHHLKLNGGLIQAGRLMTPAIYWPKKKVIEPRAISLEM